MKKILMLVCLSVLSLGLMSALPDVINGVVTIENPDVYSAGWGDPTLYTDGDILTNSGELNDLVMEYYSPNYVISGSFDYRVAFATEGAMEYSVNLDESCLLDSIIIRQTQAVDGTGNFQILTTECFGVDWVEIDSISKANEGNLANKFNMFFEESILVNVKFKKTDGLSREVIAGEILDLSLGIVEDLPSLTLAGIISETINSLTRFLEFESVRIFEDVQSNKIMSFEVYAFETSVIDWLSVVRLSSFEITENVEIKGVTNSWETFRATDGVNDGFVVNAKDGVSVMLLEANSTPTTQNIFSVYSDF